MYLYETLIPVVVSVICIVVMISYVTYRLELSNYFLFFRMREIHETSDYLRIKELIMQRVLEDMTESQVSEESMARINGAAEKTVPLIRKHKRVDIKLPQLFKKNGDQIHINITLKISDVRVVK